MGVSEEKLWSTAQRLIVSLLVVVGTLLISTPMFSQGSNGRMLGAVRDQSGGVIAGATVTIIDKDRGVARTLSTDEAGQYNAPNLIPGTYTVRAEAKGFKRLDQQNVLLEVGKEVRVDVTLEPGEQTQTITVTDEAPSIETTNATLGGTIQSDQIEQLPLNGRDYKRLMTLRPGIFVMPGGEKWDQSTNNVRPDEAVFMFDGVINNNFYDGRPIAGMGSSITDNATILPVDAIQEFNVEESPKAEFGWKPGAVVNVGIKSGTNNLHGTAYAFGRDDSFNGRNFFNTEDVGGVCLLNTKVPDVCNKRQQELEQFGATVGGPIKKDKLFFFGGYEGLRSLIGNTYTSTAPEIASTGSAANSMVDAVIALQNYIGTHPSATIATSAGSEPLKVSSQSLALLGCPTGTLTTSSVCTGGIIQGASSNSINYASIIPYQNTSDNGIGKLDYRINSKNQLTGTAFIANYTGIGADKPVVSEAFTYVLPIRAYTAIGNWIWTPSSQWVNEVRVGYTRLPMNHLLNSLDADRAANGSASGYPINTGDTASTGLPTINLTGFVTLGNPMGPSQNQPLPFWDAQDDASYLIGKHTLKFGVEYAHVEGDNGQEDRGTINFNGGGAFTGSTALEDFFAGAPTSAALITGGGFYRKEVGSEIAAFVQDDWRIKPRVILNLGLRYSYQTPYTDANGLIANFVPGTGLVQQGVGGLGSLWKPDHRDFAPRVGFAWDVTGKGDTVVRAGVSIIYSSLIVTTLGSSGGIQEPGLNNSASIYTNPTGACDVKVAAGVTCTAAGGTPLLAGGTIANASTSYSASALNWNSYGGGTVYPAGSSLVPYCIPSSPCDVLAVDPNLKIPYVTSWSTNIQHAITKDLSLQVGYVGTHGSRLLGFRDLNQAPLGAGYCMNTLTTAQSSGADGLPAACAGGALTPASGGVNGSLKLNGQTQGSLAEQEARPYFAQFPYLRFINQYTNDSYSNYDSLQATLTQRVTHGLFLLAGYTYGHGLDDGSLNRHTMIPQNSGNVAGDYASSDFDARNRFSLGGNYEIPGRKGFGQMLEGWRVNFIATLQSSMPWNVNDYTYDFSGAGDTSDRWDIFGSPSNIKEGPVTVPYCTGFSATNVSNLSGVTCTQINKAYSQTVALSSSLGTACAQSAPDPTTLARAGCYVEGNTVIVPAKLGTFGTMGRNILRDNGFKNLDFSIFKNFKFGERVGAQFRAEFFNLFNSPTFANPYGATNTYFAKSTAMDLSSPGNFGSAGETPDVQAGSPIVGSGGPRVIQLGLKLTF